jgi:hypothetical protein
VIRSSNAKKTREKKETEKELDPEKPRVAWHGDFFRENFYHKRIPEVLNALPPDHTLILRTILFSILKSNNEERQSFGRRASIVKKYGYTGIEDTWDFITRMDHQQLKIEIRQVAIAIVLQSTHFNSMLHLIADHIGIDLHKEWRIDKEFLEKKTIAEMTTIGKELGIFSEQKAVSFLINLKKKKFEGLSKKELIRVFLESGVDLVGRVPKEILDKRTIRERQTGMKTCRRCDGDGDIVQRVDETGGEEYIECPDCGGEGQVPIDPTTVALDA